MAWEKPSEASSRELIAQIATFFAKKYNEKIVIVTKVILTDEEAKDLFSKLEERKRSLIRFMYCGSYQKVLDKLLELDSSTSIPKFLIVESLHQWYDHTTSLEKIPSIFATIIAATQDLVNVNSKLLKQSCFSFITCDTDELPIPTSIVEMFYDFVIDSGNVDQLLDKMEGKTIDSLCEDELLNVFEYLGTKDLKTSTLVCKRWNDIIGNHVSTMRNLPLVFDETNKEKEIPELIRKYHTIKLKRFELDDNLFENVVKHLTYDFLLI
ncbi:CLUMA_CG004380, isoform D [Clunio marinus]|uniref:CLUMA_CG004380, isoform D n=1 Tax=Clunio marinus TaxID=568069 RepID=A0A1J1HRJ8_9DIPT|nr:CLUMA_CG004380, isoform D [Clunio marinus]